MTHVCAKCVCSSEYGCRVKELVSQDKLMLDLVPSSKISREMVWGHTRKPCSLRDRAELGGVF